MDNSFWIGFVCGALVVEFVCSLAIVLGYMLARLEKWRMLSL